MILVTGGTGLVGSELIRLLCEKGKPVRALYRNKIPAIVGADNVEWIKADILDIIALEEAMQGVGQVYHCAAIVSFSSSKKLLMYKTNIEGTANIVNACINKNVSKLLFVSSVAALGKIKEAELINETMNWTPDTCNSEYGRTKYMAELEVWRGMSEGLSVVIVNPVIILGSGDWNSGSSGIFKSAYDEFPWYTQGMSGFVDVMDVVKAMEIIMESDLNGERFILCAHNLLFRDLFTQIALAFNKKPPHKMVTPFLAALIWRLEAIKAFFTKKDPLLTKETAKTAQTKVSFNNTKLLEHFKEFSYTPLDISIKRICTELKKKYILG